MIDFANQTSLSLWLWDFILKNCPPQERLGFFKVLQALVGVKRPDPAKLRPGSWVEIAHRPGCELGLCSSQAIKALDNEEWNGRRLLVERARNTRDF